jgi:hypothetical protein
LALRNYFFNFYAHVDISFFIALDTLEALDQTLNFILFFSTRTADGRPVTFSYTASLPQMSMTCCLYNAGLPLCCQPPPVS